MKNKESLKLIRDCPHLVVGSDYFLVNSVNNPTKIRIGYGLTELKLVDSSGNEFLLHGNQKELVELFKVNDLFSISSNKEYVLLESVENLKSNTHFKKLDKTSYYDVSVSVGSGLGEFYFIEQYTNNIIRFTGNQNKITSLFKEIKTVTPPVLQPKTIILKEQISIPGPQGPKGETGIMGAMGIRGEKGEKGEKGDKGDIGQIGPIGPIGPKGERGDTGDQGLQGIQGIPGLKGDRGEIGPQGIQGIQGLQGQIGPMGPRGTKGDRGEKGDQGEAGPIGPQGPMGAKGDIGEKGERGDRGPMGPQGPIGPRGEKGEPGTQGPPGAQGPQGPIGISPVLTAEYPIKLENNKLTFDSDRLTKLLDKFKNTDIQRAIDQMAKTMPSGGGAVGINFNGSKLIKSVSDIDFTGSGVNVTRNGKNVTVNIAGLDGAVTSLIAGAGITLSPISGIGNVTITNLISVKGSPGDIQIATNDGDLERRSGFNIDSNSEDLNLPKGIKLNSTNAFSEAFIQFSDGSTQGSAPNKFYYQSSRPSGTTMGDRWMDSDNGIEYIYINDGDSEQWVQPTNSSGNGQGFVPVYGSFYDTTTQGATLGNTGYAMKFNSTDYSNGVSIENSSHIKVDYTGIYNIQFSAQLDKSTASKATVDIWLRKNGTDIPATNTAVAVAGSSAKVVAAWNFYVGATAGDYFQLMWAADDTDTVLHYANSNAVHPSTPSVILTVNKIN